MIAPPLSLYVHLPWCVRKCPYCDFNSYSSGATAPRDRYLDALERDLADEARRSGGRDLQTVFLGGGTPSLFTAAEIARLLDAIRQNFTLAADAEITMEANPGTVESDSPAGYRAAGVNRLSIGAQSFSSAMLATLGRIHSSDDIGRAFDAARAAGFEQINLDVMYALPGQDIDGALDDINAALQLEPEHFSWYQLTLEPNTVFHARPPAGMPDNDLASDIQNAGQALLAGRGYRQYEVSAYARDGDVCRHNLNYWTFGDYLAVGAGAHGKLTSDGKVTRYTKPANPLSYMQYIESLLPGAGPGELPAALGEAELLFEFMLNALRLCDGFAETLFVARTGLGPERLASAAAPAIEKGLIGRTAGGWWQPTQLGQRFMNDLQEAFLP
jgi:oxygen-independent coproporphyrinogen-3 oxidase